MRHLILSLGTILSFGMGLLLSSLSGFGQSPTSCAIITSATISTTLPGNCPNVGGTPFASNFISTAYATVPVLTKRGNMQFSYAGANPSLTPFAITRIWQTNGGVTTLITGTAFGPAAVPAVSGGNTLVNYCFYGTTPPAAGTVSFELTDPVTGIVWGICSYSAACASNCSVVANPVVLLPVNFTSFKATSGVGRTGLLEWTTASEQNNKGYTVERSIDGAGFEAIGFVPTINPGGNSDAPSRYSYNDLSIPNGQNIGYRLRQEDLDGKGLYSEIQVLQLKGSDGPGIYSNGRTVTINFPVASQSKGQEILVHDTEGRTIHHYHLSAGRQYIINDLPTSHLYYISVREEGSKGATVKSIFLAP